MLLQEAKREESFRVESFMQSVVRRESSSDGYNNDEEEEGEAKMRDKHFPVAVFCYLILQKDSRLRDAVLFQKASRKERLFLRTHSHIHIHTHEFTSQTQEERRTARE